MFDFAPGMGAIIRDEDWIVKKTGSTALAIRPLYGIDISLPVKDREAWRIYDYGKNRRNRNSEF